MSLFENEQYEYTDTFFVFFDRENLPDPEAVKATIAGLGTRYEFGEMAFRGEQFESMTIVSPQDFSAIDIVLDLNTEVTTQIDDIVTEFRSLTLSSDDREKLAKFKTMNSRFDLFHFEKKFDGEESNTFVDPGGLLIVLDKLRSLCDGVAIDPQSQVLL